MDSCSYVKERLVDFLAGELTIDDKKIVISHLEVCKSCKKEFQAIKGVVSLTCKIEEMEPSTRIWQNLQDTIIATERSKKIRWLYVATTCAATILIAFLCYNIFYPFWEGEIPVAKIVKIYSDRGLERQEKWISIGEVVKTGNYAIVDIQGFGSFRTHKGSIFRFNKKNEIEITEGELFLEITPQGQGFTIRTDDVKVNVVGTKFGVKKSKQNSGSFVYIIEGNVMVSNDKGGLIGCSGDVICAISGIKPEIRFYEKAHNYITWLKEYEVYSPTLDISVDRNSISRDEILIVKVTISNTTSLPILLEPVDEKPPYLSFGIIDPDNVECYITLVKEMIKARDSPPIQSGFIKLEKGEKILLTCEFKPELFTKNGLYKLKVNYICRTEIKGAWSGSISSRFVEFEVR